MSRTRRGPTRHTLRCLRSQDILDREVDVFQVIRSNIVLAYTDLNFQNNLLGDLHCQAILHTPHHLTTQPEAGLYSLSNLQQLHLCYYLHLELSLAALPHPIYLLFFLSSLQHTPLSQARLFPSPASGLLPEMRPWSAMFAVSCLPCQMPSFCQGQTYISMPPLLFLPLSLNS